MSGRDYQSAILEAIKGLPSESLAEIAGFVEFVRSRSPGQRRIARDLRQLSRGQEAHLEEEFAGHDKLYPRE